MLIGDQVGIRATALAVALGRLRPFSIPVIESFYDAAHVQADDGYAAWARSVASVRPWNGLDANASDHRFLAGRGQTTSTSQEPIVVRRIRGTQLFQAVDGHHRLGRLAGSQFIAARVLPIPTVSPLRNYLSAHDDTRLRQLRQPIDLPDVAELGVALDCEAIAHIFELELEGRKRPPGSFLDINCAYGWFVRWAADRGWSSTGFTSNPLTPVLASEVYGVAQSAIHSTDRPSRELKKLGPRSVVHWATAADERPGTMAFEARLAEVASLAEELVFVTIDQPHPPVDQAHLLSVLRSSSVNDQWGLTIHEGAAAATGRGSTPTLIVARRESSQG